MLNSANATVQLSVAPAMRGRVMALYMMIFMGGTPIGAPIVGWVGETFGARWTLIGGGGDRSSAPCSRSRCSAGPGPRSGHDPRPRRPRRHEVVARPAPWRPARA